MTIEFPKLPNDRRKHKRAINSETNLSFTPAAKPAAPAPPTEPLPNESVYSQPPEVEISAAELEELKARIKAPKKTKAKMNKYLPLVAGLLVMVGLGVFAYPMLQNMWHEKTATPPVATPTKPSVAKTTISSTATTAPITASSAPVVATPVAPMPQATLPSETVTNTPPTSATPSQTPKEDDLQRPVLVDNVSPTNNPAPSAKSQLTENKASDDQKIPAKSDSLKPSSQEVAVAPVPKNTRGMSYDEFVKASDTAVFIEPATTGKK